MSRYPIQLSEELRALVAPVADELGLTADELAGKSAEDDPALDARFWDALRATLEKNKELYRRLARH